MKKVIIAAALLATSVSAFAGQETINASCGGYEVYAVGSFYKSAYYDDFNVSKAGQAVINYHDEGQELYNSVETEDGGSVENYAANGNDMLIFTIHGNGSHSASLMLNGHFYKCPISNVVFKK